MTSRDDWEFPWAEVLDDPVERPDEEYEAEAAYFGDLCEASEERPDDSEAYRLDLASDSSAPITAGAARTNRSPQDEGADGFASPALFSAGPLSLDTGPPLLPLFIVVLVLISLAL